MTTQKAPLSWNEIKKAQQDPLDAQGVVLTQIRDSLGDIAGALHQVSHALQRIKNEGIKTK